jgi:hypothetical protein
VDTAAGNSGASIDANAVPGEELGSAVVDSFDRFRSALGTVPAQHGANTVVGPSVWDDVMVAHYVQGGRMSIERHYTADLAGGLAGLLEEAADFVNGRGTHSDGRHTVGVVGGDVTDSYGPTDVGALWPLVEMTEMLADGRPHLGLEYTPGHANELARLLREAADLLEE